MPSEGLRQDDCHVEPSFSLEALFYFFFFSGTVITREYYSEGFPR